MNRLTRTNAPVLSVHVLLTENALARDFVSSFRARRLAEKFFYWFPLSVRAWLALCSDGAYRNFVRSRSLIARNASDLADRVPPGPVQVVSLGSGQGDKDLMLLQALSARPVSYLAVDSSQALLEMAVAGALASGIAAHGLKADFTNPGHLASLEPDGDTPPRVVLLLGNTLGAFDPLEEARAVRQLLRPGDQLLVDGEVYAGVETVAGYDNLLNRSFAWAPLHAVGIGEADGEIVFEDGADDRVPGLHPLRKFFRASRNLEARLGGEVLAVAAGDRLAMNHSYKYDRETFPRILEDAGFRVTWRGTSEDERFQMVLARVP